MVYLDGENVVPSQIAWTGEQIAQKMFKEIGLDVKWSRQRFVLGKGDQQFALNLRIINSECGLPEDAVAIAGPYGGSNIVLCYSRIKWAERDLSLASKLFAHVLVHEITHLLQRINRHSDTGIMKAAWTDEDYHQMRHKPLRFEPVDLELIRIGIAERKRRMHQDLR